VWGGGGGGSSSCSDFIANVHTDKD